MLKLLPLLILLIVTPLKAQNNPVLPPCDQRPNWLDNPVVDPSIFCLERVIDDPMMGELAFTGLTVSPDGTLYAAHPLRGTVYAIKDTDNDLLPDTSTSVIDGLNLPNAIVYYDDALYIAGASEVYRWRVETEELETLVDDLPIDTSFWVSGMTIGEDERLYIGVSAACDTCSPTDERSVILSFDLNGEDRRIVASGFRYPAGLAWREGDLWVTDTARDALQNGRFDELNRVVLTGGNYGFPGCIGIENQADLGTDEACSEVIPPAFALPSQSMPISLVSYTSDTLPTLTGSLLLVLGGSRNESRLRGFALASVKFNNENQPEEIANLLPALEIANRQYEGSGLYPHRPYGVAVSPEGWIYLSVGGGKIYALRPL